MRHRDRSEEAGHGVLGGCGVQCSEARVMCAEEEWVQRGVGLEEGQRCAEQPGGKSRGGLLHCPLECS